MLNKKVIAMALVAASLFVGCSGTEQPENQEQGVTNVEQGEISAEQPAAFTGSKTLRKLYDQTGKKSDVVVATVDFENGKAVKVSLDVELEDGSSKKELSANGGYVMAEDSEKRWDEQLVLFEEYLNGNGVDMSALNLTEAGNTDAISGVSIKIGAYADTVKEVIDSVNNGTELPEGFTGAKVVETPYDPTGEKKDIVVAKVVYQNGTPVNATLDVKLEDGSSKKELSANGGYVMAEDSEKRWDEQITELETFIVTNGFDLSKLNVSEEGKTDAVSGVSIKVKPYVEALTNALNAQ